MTRKEIVARRKEIETATQQAQRDIEHYRLNWLALQKVCPHPKIRNYSAMGEPGRFCPDCEYQT